MDIQLSHYKNFKYRNILTTNMLKSKDPHNDGNLKIFWLQIVTYNDEASNGDQASSTLRILTIP